MRNRPVPNIIMKTNTSATMRFMTRPVEERCNAIVISHPPVTFGIIVENKERPLPGFPIVSNSCFCVYFYCIIYTTIVHI